MVLAVNGLVVIPLLAWAIVSMQEQVRSEERNIDTESLGLANTYFPRDVRNAMVAAVDSQLSGGATLPDCVGDIEGGGDSGEVKVALLTAGNRLIVYKVTDAPAGSDYKGQVMWRRECDNGSGAVTPPEDSGIPSGLSGTNVINERVVSERIDSITAVCPAPTAGNGGPSTDADCWSVKLSARIIGVTRVAVLQASRRVNILTAPGSPPVARVTYFPAAVSTCTDLTLDATRSTDPFDEGISHYAWRLLEVIDDGSGTHTEEVMVESGSSPMWMISVVDLPDKGQYQVELTVTAGSPTSENGERTGFTVTSLTIGDCVPVTSITHLKDAPWPTGAVPRLNIGESFSVKGVVTSTDATGAIPLSYTWSWGEDDSAGIPKTTGPLDVSSCANTVNGPCDVSATFGGFDSLGVKRIMLTVTDAQGRNATTQRTVYVVSNVYYVSAASTDDSGSCGPISTPCKSLVQAAANAKTNGKTVIRVAAGPTNPTSTTYQYRQGPITLAGVADLTIDGAWTYDTTSGEFGERPTTDNRRPLISDAASADASNRTGSAIVVDGSTVTLTNLDIVSSNAPAVTQSDLVPKSSYGVRVINGSSVHIGNSQLQGGNGANAADVSVAAPGPATGGGSAGNGKDASGATLFNKKGGGAGGGGGSGANNGGSGGTGGHYNGAGSGGSKGSGSSGGNGGSGGCGSTFGCSGDAGGGKAGASGTAGSGGAPASLTPVPDSTWRITRGANGTPGGAGSGGGGGGGGKSASASGGGGGGGGAGGAGGTAATHGGYSGGGSFGLYVYNSTVVVKNSVIKSSAGGKGGAGQPGGKGGFGGTGGKGGDKYCCEAGGGGGGGGGGAGGGGGGAGSGNGGPTVAVFAIGSGNTTFQGSNTFTNLGAAGAGGPVGPKSASGVGGVGGARGNCALVGGCAGGNHDGQDAGAGAQGEGGKAGATGLKYRTWIKGATS